MKKTNNNNEELTGITNINVDEEKIREITENNNVKLKPNKKLSKLVVALVLSGVLSIASISTYFIVDDIKNKKIEENASRYVEQLMYENPLPEYPSMPNIKYSLWMPEIEKDEIFTYADQMKKAKEINLVDFWYDAEPKEVDAQLSSRMDSSDYSISMGYDPANENKYTIIFYFNKAESKTSVFDILHINDPKHQLQGYYAAKVDNHGYQRILIGNEGANNILSFWDAFNLPLTLVVNESGEESVLLKQSDLLNFEASRAIENGYVGKYPNGESSTLIESNFIPSKPKFYKDNDIIFTGEDVFEYNIVFPPVKEYRTY